MIIAARTMAITAGSGGRNSSKRYNRRDTCTELMTRLARPVYATEKGMDVPMQKRRDITLPQAPMFRACTS